MKLLTKEIIEALPKLYSTDNVSLEDKIVICKFFTPDSYWTWFVFEGEPIKDESGKNTDDFIFFGMVHGFEKEMGNFVLSELEQCSGPLGLPIERDLFVFKKSYKVLMKKLENYNNNFD